MIKLFLLFVTIIHFSYSSSLHTDDLLRFRGRVFFARSKEVIDDTSSLILTNTCDVITFYPHVQHDSPRIREKSLPFSETSEN